MTQNRIKIFSILKNSASKKIDINQIINRIILEIVISRILWKVAVRQPVTARC